MIAVYGIFSLSLIFILALIITPNLDRQTRGWRKTRKHGQQKIPVLGDAAPATLFVAIMSILAALGWYVFTCELVESTIGAWATTVTVSASVLTLSDTLSSAVPPSDTWMPVCKLVVKPESSAVTSYKPGGRFGNRYAPVSLLTVVGAPGTARPRRVRVTPGNTAPDSSVTTPRITPVVVCAHPDTGLASSTTTARTQAIERRMSTSQSVTKYRSIAVAYATDASTNDYIRVDYRAVVRLCQ